MCDWTQVVVGSEISRLVCIGDAFRLDQRVDGASQTKLLQRGEGSTVSPPSRLIEIQPRRLIRTLTGVIGCRLNCTRLITALFSSYASRSLSLSA